VRVLCPVLDLIRGEEEGLTIPLKHHDSLRRGDGDFVFLGILDSMIERWGQDSAGLFGDGLPQGLYQLEEALAVKGELGTPTGVCHRRVGHGVELGPGKVVTIHGNEGGEGGLNAVPG
jgi:hypothetical protein